MGRNPSYFSYFKKGKGDNLPVEQVSWYDCVEFCNRRSEKEGLTPIYHIDKSKQDPNNNNKDDEIKWAVTLNEKANGYRLPTEAEWEYAATGGQMSKSYLYSGSDNIDEVAVYIENSGSKTVRIGSKKPNELGIYDMTGNVWEWVWDRSGSDSSRITRGGSWINNAGINYLRGYRPTHPLPWHFSEILGFRIARSIP